MDPLVVDLVKIHFSFIIIAGGQLILFNQILSKTEEINSKINSTGDRYEWWIGILLCAEYILFFFVFILTLFLFIFRMYEIGNLPFFKTNQSFLNYYLVILLLIMIIQTLARLNFGRIKKLKNTLDEITTKI